MFAICIESSHKKGMGHLYRSINLINELHIRKINSIVYINENKEAIDILEQKKIRYRVVDLYDLNSKWEEKLIKKDRIKVWINDRLDTSTEHINELKIKLVKVISFDDFGDGASNLDLNIVGLYCSDQYKVKGINKCVGREYLILDPEIGKYKKQRTNICSIAVTLGGSDTHGVTINVIKQLKNIGKNATILLGPSFNHHDSLKKVIDSSFNIISNVKSMAAELSNYDLAITGGGITAFEAAASGLPILMIANEIFEVPVCIEIQKLGIGKYLGLHNQFKINQSDFNIPLKEMSINGMRLINPFGVKSVVDEIIKISNND